MLQALGTIKFRYLQKKSKKNFHACVPLKREARRSPILWGLLKLQRHLIQLLAIWKQSANNAHSYIQLLKRHYEQFWNLFHMAHLTLNPECCYSLYVTVLRDIGNDALTSSAILATAHLTPPRWWLYEEDGKPQFSPWKSRHKCRQSLRHDVFHSRFGNSFPNRQQLYEVAWNL